MAAETLGDKITELRKQAGLKRSELALGAGLHPSHIGMIERGERSRLRSDTAQKLARALSVDVKDLIGGDTLLEDPLATFRPVAEKAIELGLTPGDLLALLRWFEMARLSTQHSSVPGGDGAATDRTGGAP